MSMHMCWLLLFLGIIAIAQSLPNYHDQQKDTLLQRLTQNLRARRAESCPDSTLCRSQWGYCGTGDAYCGDGCQAGPCYNSNNNNNDDIINSDTFACSFNTIDDTTRTNQYNALQNSGWKPVNKDEAAVFLAHVFHETDGLKTMREYCAPGCGSNYAGSWCSIQGNPNKLYYGRGWFQLSWPCNYYAAGQSLGVDLLSDPDSVEQQLVLAVKTALWFYTARGMDGPAQQGDFAATTRIINGQIECNSGPGAANQAQRVATYERIRSCFGLGAPTKNPTC